MPKPHKKYARRTKRAIKHPKTKSGTQMRSEGKKALRTGTIRKKKKPVRNVAPNVKLR